MAFWVDQYDFSKNQVIDQYDFSLISTILVKTQVIDQYDFSKKNAIDTILVKNPDY